MQLKKSKDFFKSLAAAFTDVDADNKMLLAVIDVINKDGEDARIDVANTAPAVCARFYLVDPARDEQAVVPAGDYTVAVIITDTTNAAINSNENELDSEKENISAEGIETMISLS